MADGDAGRCEPYRVEWHLYPGEQWKLMDTQESLAAAEMTATRLLHACGGQVRVVEQRVVLVRGLGQDTGPDQAFMDYTRRMADLAGSVAERNERIHGPSSEPEESEQAMPDGLLFSERELWKVAAVDGWIDGSEMFDVLARLARVRAELRACRGPSVVSDPDDRRDVEAAADAGQPMGSGWRTYRGVESRDSMGRRVVDLEPMADADQPMTLWGIPVTTDSRMPPGVVGFVPTGHGEAPDDEEEWTQRLRATLSRDPVTDMAGCAHRMSSGAVSLTACGECGARPYEDCVAWRLMATAPALCTERMADPWWRRRTRAER